VDEKGKLGEHESNCCSEIPTVQKKLGKIELEDQKVQLLFHVGMKKV